MSEFIDELKRKYAASTQGEWLDAGSGSPFWVKLAGDEFGAGWRVNRDNDAMWVSSIHNAFPAIISKLEAQQARIESLLLEYCPDEMTAEEIENWGKHQRPSTRTPNEA